MKGRRIVCSRAPLSGIHDPRVPSVPKIIVNDTTDNFNVLVERRVLYKRSPKLNVTATNYKKGTVGIGWICKTRLVHGFHSRKVIAEIVSHSSRPLRVLR